MQCNGSEYREESLTHDDAWQGRPDKGTPIVTTVAGIQSARDTIHNQPHSHSNNPSIACERL